MVGGVRGDFNVIKSKPKVTSPAVIQPNGVYRPRDLEALLGVPLKGVRRAVRHDGLKRAKRGNKYYILGQWILDWIAAGEIKGGVSRT